MNTLNAVSGELKYLGLNFKALMEKSGICVDLLSIPLERSAEMLKDGAIDGQVVITEDLGNLIQDVAIAVDIPFGKSVAWIIYSPELKTDINTIGVVRGAKWTQRVLRSNPPDFLSEDYTLVYGSTHQNLVSMLSRNRLMAILGTTREIQAIDTAGLGLSKQRLGDLFGYTYLHKRHAAYIPLIRQAYQAYKEKGCLLDDPQGIQDICLATN